MSSIGADDRNLSDWSSLSRAAKKHVLYKSVTEADGVRDWSEISRQDFGRFSLDGKNLVRLTTGVGLILPATAAGRPRRIRVRLTLQPGADTILHVERADTTTVTEALQICGFFAGLDQETILKIRPAARRIRQPKGTVIFREGEQCRGFYVVESGAVKIFKESQDAKEHVVHVATRGDCFGEAALFLGIGYPASASAVQNSSLIMLRKDEFLAVLRESPEVCLHLMASMATWAHRLITSIEALTLKDAAARFASYILAKSPKDGQIINLGVPKQVIASHLGITGETLSRLLARFEAEGIIETLGSRLKIISGDKLAEAADYGLA